MSTFLNPDHSLEQDSCSIEMHLFPLGESTHICPLSMYAQTHNICCEWRHIYMHRHIVCTHCETQEGYWVHVGGGGGELPHLSHEIAKRATGRLKNRQAHVCACAHAFVCPGPILSHGILCDAQTFSGNAINPLIISFHLQCTHDFNRLVHVSHEHTLLTRFYWF